MKRLAYNLILLTSVFVALPAFAQIEITEIMYDVEGADTGFEWVEITNTSGASIEISEWHFYEAEVHHGLSPDGFSVLDSGERALIVQDFDAVYELYGNNQNLIKSSFSLNNTGEILGLSDPDKVIMTSISYSSDDGASGDGFSLQRSESAWLSGTPTPGAANIHSSQIPNQEDNSPGESSSSSKKNKNSSIRGETEDENEYYIPHLTTTGLLTQNADIYFEGHVIHSNGPKKSKKIKGGSYYLNFGDGFSIESDERIEYTHSYEYPGTYTIVFEFYANRFNKDLEKPPRAYIERDIIIHADNVSITSLDDFGNVGITNTSGSRINMESWTLTSLAGTYTFPKHSYIQDGATIVIPRTIHEIEINNGQGIYLYNSKGIRVAASTNLQDPTENIGMYNDIESRSVVQVINDVPKNQTQSFEDKFLAAHPDKVVIPQASVSEIPATQDAESHTSLPIAIPITIFLVSIGLAIYKIIQEKDQKENPDSSQFYYQDDGAEIELIED